MWIINTLVVGVEKVNELTVYNRYEYNKPKIESISYIVNCKNKQQHQKVNKFFSWIKSYCIPLIFLDQEIPSERECVSHPPCLPQQTNPLSPERT